MMLNCSACCSPCIRLHNSLQVLCLFDQDDIFVLYSTIWHAHLILPSCYTKHTSTQIYHDLFNWHNNAIAYIGLVTHSGLLNDCV